MKYKTDDYQVSPGEYLLMMMWCREQFERALWDYHYESVKMNVTGHFSFKNEKDRTWFLLRWS
jgi:hypothetical protein